MPVEVATQSRWRLVLLDLAQSMRGLPGASGRILAAALRMPDPTESPWKFVAKY